MNTLMKPLAIAAMLIAMLSSSANAAEMPKHLVGQWCQTVERTDNGDGNYIKAKNFCKETRPVAFTIHQLGFWIKLANVRAQILCKPLEVENWAHGWNVVADCGADDLSTPVYRLGFTFEPWQDKMEISRWVPQENN
jgi:hypothetical protein